VNLLKDSSSVHFSTMWQTIYNIFNSKILTFPFPHWYTQNIFPHNFFLKIREHLPRKESYTSITESGRVNATKVTAAEANRYIFDINEYNLNQIEKEKSIFWNDFLKVFSDDSLLQALLNFILPYVNKRDLTTPLEICWSLSKDYSDYSLFVHTDIPKKVASLLFYIPSSEKHSQYGTSIYVPKEDFSDLNILKKNNILRRMRMDFELFHKLKTFDFLPNTLFGFICSNDSFHSVEPLKEDFIERDILSLTLIKK
jgi:hypothetical protein